MTYHKFLTESIFFFENDLTCPKKQARLKYLFDYYN